MAYATQADLLERIDQARLVQLTDYEQTGEVDDAKVTRALNYATAMVDSYTTGRYGSPLVVSDQVKRLAVVIALRELYSARQLELPEVVRRDYEDAINFLREVRDSKASLDQPAKTQTSALGVKRQDDADQKFNADNLEGLS